MAPPPASPAQLRQLSGGEQRRVGLALSLAFGELAAERGGLTCDFLVLDEARAPETPADGRHSPFVSPVLFVVFLLCG